MEVAEFLCSYRRVFVPLLKSRFFVIYFRGVTLADEKASLVQREVDERSEFGGIGNPPVCSADSPLYTRGPFVLQ